MSTIPRPTPTVRPSLPLAPRPALRLVPPPPGSIERLAAALTAIAERLRTWAERVRAVLHRWADALTSLALHRNTWTARHARRTSRQERIDRRSRRRALDRALRQDRRARTLTRKTARLSGRA